MADDTNQEFAAPAATPTLDTDKPFRLMDLPTELVLRVLRYAVVRSSKTNPISVTFPLPPEDGSKVQRNNIEIPDGRQDLMQPAIMRVNGLLRIEGLKMFYAENYFRTRCLRLEMRMLRKWLDGIRETHAFELANLWVEWCDDDGDSMFVACLTRSDVIEEVDYLKSFLLEWARYAHLRWHNKKLVLGSGSLSTCYQLALSKTGAETKTRKWMALSSIRCKGTDDVDTDFWTVDEEA